MKKSKRHIITAALPYANGPIHIGHLAGCYLPADIYVRHLKSKGEDVLFVCGSDEHGVPITIKAKKEGISPQEVVDKYHKMMGDAFKQFGIEFSIYSRTSKAIHHQTASEIFKTLYDKGKFIEEITEQYFDEQANQFLADRYITGICPKCAYESAYGDQCEKCGSSLNPTDLINPRSALSGNTPVLRKTKNWFLPLDKMQPDIEAYIESHSDWKPNVYGQCKSWLKQGLQARAMTRDLDWGVKVPLPDAEGKVLYVWFDAPIGYISATKELRPDDWEKYWKKQENPDDDARLIHFIGKDNIVFHCLIFPATLMAEGTYITPDFVPANEFLNLEGDKISTSRNHAVWLHEYLEDFPSRQDELRYVLTSIAPETSDSNFSWKDFQARINNELADILGNYIKRVVDLTHRFCEGKVPEVSGITLDEEKEYLQNTAKTEEQIYSNLDHFKFREAQSLLMDLARQGNQFLQMTEPWKLIKTDARKVDKILHICLCECVRITRLMFPFLPSTAKRLCLTLNLPEDSSKWNSFLENGNLKTGHPINASEVLFPKITDEEIEVQIEKLKKKPIGMDSETAEEKKDFHPAKDPITYEDFSKLDIRIGTILEAERVPKTDKLLKLLIDTGLDKRTVISGIAGFYEPEKIIGQKVSILVNLQPRKLKGIESHGMILMAENTDGKLSFVLPSEEAENGSTVS